MASAADAVIAALGAGAAELDPLVPDLTDEQLTGPSAASEWTLAQVLSHLGSGAEITGAGLAAALAGKPRPEFEANRAVWAVWDARTPREMADGYLVANAELLAAYDALDAGTRDNLRVDMGFLPEPVSLAEAARWRLMEFGLHSWDLRVALDPAAVVHPQAAPQLLGQAAFMLGFLAKADALQGRTADLLVSLSDPESALGLSLGEAVAITGPPAAPDGTLALPAEAWLRLLTGRLAPDHTPPGITATGPVDLDTLRAVFTGY